LRCRWIRCHLHHCLLYHLLPPKVFPNHTGQITAADPPRNEGTTRGAQGRRHPSDLRQSKIRFRFTAV
ncbi:hypothetical protein DXG03_008184, partial [Asterophora parasitica]